MRAIGPLVLACLVLGCAMTQRMNVAVAEGSTSEWKAYRADSLEFEVPSTWQAKATPSSVMFSACDAARSSKWDSGSFSVPGCIAFSVRRRRVLSEERCRTDEIPSLQEGMLHLGPQTATNAEGTLGGAPATRFDMMKRFHDETTRYTTWAVCRGSELWTFSYLAPETEAVELERAQQQLVRTVVWR
jgi:hypothetical protein